MCLSPKYCISSTTTTVFTMPRSGSHCCLALSTIHLFLTMEDYKYLLQSKQHQALHEKVLKYLGNKNLKQDKLDEQVLRFTEVVYDTKTKECSLIQVPVDAIDDIILSEIQDFTIDTKQNVSRIMYLDEVAEHVFSPVLGGACDSSYIEGVWFFTSAENEDEIIVLFLQKVSKDFEIDENIEAFVLKSVGETGHLFDIFEDPDCHQVYSITNFQDSAGSCYPIGVYFMTFGGGPEGGYVVVYDKSTFLHLSVLEVKRNWHKPFTVRILNQAKIYLSRPESNYNPDIKVTTNSGANEEDCQLHNNNQLIDFGLLTDGELTI